VGFLFYDIFIVMKKIVKLTESDLVRIVQRVVQEGKTDKGVKEKDSDVKIERFQDTIKNFIKSHDCKVKQVGDDFEIHSDGEHVGQVMFRKDGITVKKQGSKFGKEFDFNELGKVKSEIKKLTESDLTGIVKRVIKENEEDTIRIPRKYDGVRMELGKDANPQDIIDMYNEVVASEGESVPLEKYEDGYFWNAHMDDIMVDVILDELNYAIVGDEEDYDDEEEEF
jgi:hypothetical protein